MFGGDMLDKLLKLLKGENLCAECPNAELDQIAELSAEQMREWAIIKAETERLDKEIARIGKEKELLTLRKKMFTGKIQLRSGDMRSKLVIKNGKAFRVECKDTCSDPTGGLFGGSGDSPFKGFPGFPGPDEDK